jgi:single-stranded-DNA-specific exonuclease
MIPVESSPALPWSIAPRISEAEQSLLGADSLLLAQLLWNREIRTSAEAIRFLEPRYEHLADPNLMHGLPEAVERLLWAIHEHEQIVVYGDYDVDGVAGAAVLVQALRRLGADVFVHIPHRSRDGYGVNLAAVRELAAQAKVMITVDCGITAGDEIEAATALGLEVIVTDHHTIPSQLPAARAVLNPHQADCEYPCKVLAGGGVALTLARGMFLSVLDPEEAQREILALTPLAALSTVADVMPLIGENRTIVRLGLDVMRKGSRPGLDALCASSGRPLERLTARDLAFSIIPRLNAAGRMGDARHTSVR